MAEEQHALEQTMRRAGIFDDRTIYGIQYRDEQGKFGWHVTTWPNEGDPIDDYWVEGKKFYEMLRIDIPGYPGMRNRIETGRLIIEMSQEKQNAVLVALAKWEAE